MRILSSCIQKRVALKEKIIKNTHRVKIRDYIFLHIPKSHFLHYYSNNYMVPNACISICESCLHIQHCVSILVHVYYRNEIYLKCEITN